MNGDEWLLLAERGPGDRTFSLPLFVSLHWEKKEGISFYLARHRRREELIGSPRRLTGVGPKCG